jgi:hypothetical protein
VVRATFVRARSPRRLGAPGLFTTPSRQVHDPATCWAEAPGSLSRMDLLEISAFRWFLVVGAAVLPLLVRLV